MRAFTLTEPHPKLREADVATDIKKWLKTRRWHVQRLQSGVVNFGQNPDGSPRLRQLGRKGMADFCCWRPVTGRLGLVEMFFLEVKRPGQSPRPEQVKWLRERMVEGFVAIWADCREAFVKAYLECFRES